jgi:hypothetical protein
MGMRGSIGRLRTRAQKSKLDEKFSVFHIMWHQMLPINESQVANDQEGNVRGPIKGTVRKLKLLVCDPRKTQSR